MFSSEPIAQDEAEGKDKQNTQEDVPASFCVPCGGEVFVPVFYHITLVLKTRDLRRGRVKLCLLKKL